MRCILFIFEKEKGRSQMS